MKTSTRSNIKNIASTLGLLMLSSACMAHPTVHQPIRSPAMTGGSDRGGGEPGAIEFIAIANKLANWLGGHPSSTLTSNAVRESARNLWEHLNSDNDEQLLIFTDSDVNCEIAGSYINKLACTDNGKVTVNRAAWNAISAQQKVEAVTLEIAKLNDLEARYSLAAEIGRHYREIDSSSDKTIVTPTAVENENTDLRTAKAEVFVTIQEDIHIKSGDDEIWFYDNKARSARTLDQLSYEGSAASEKVGWFMTLFGPSIGKFPEYKKPMCLIELSRTSGGVLRKGRVFRVSKPDDSSGKRVWIEDLGSLSCANQPQNKITPKAFKPILGLILGFKFDFKKAADSTSTEQDY